MNTRPIRSSAPLSWLTIAVGIATVGSAACSAERSRQPTSGKSIAKVRRILIIPDVAERLVPIFAHSFEHSMISALESNGAEAVVVTATSPASDAEVNHAKKAQKFVPDATMRITVKPLYRTRADGYAAIVGTKYEAILIDSATEKRIWQTTGKVDYIRMFGRHYRASPGIKREFAWNTTAGIVRKFVTEVNGQKPATIFTVIEERQRHGQRVD